MGAGPFDVNFVVLRYWDTAKQEEVSPKPEYRVLTVPKNVNGVPIGIPKGYSTDSDVTNTSLDTLKLTLIDTVKPSAFDGSSGVRTKDGYYELARTRRLRLGAEPVCFAADGEIQLHELPRIRQ